MTKQPAKPDYESLKNELDNLMSELMREDLSLDDALKSYERGLVLIELLESHIKTAENTVVKLKAKFNDKAS
ncbi:MAG: hypothetical protein NVS1B10_01160 [Candidatus Saccharimonadales bacterium]